MRTMIPIQLLILCIFASWGRAESDVIRGISSIGGEKDGIRIVFTEVQVKDSSKPQLFIEIENTNREVVNYASEGASLRMLFKLIAHDGNEIKPDEIWWRGIDPKPESIRNAPGAIPPGGKVGYYLDLEKAYGSDWNKGAKLLVTWNPGYWPGAGPHKFGWGLEAGYDMAPLVTRAFPTEKPSGGPHEAFQDLVPRSSLDPPASLTPEISEHLGKSGSYTNGEIGSRAGLARVWIIPFALGTVVILLIILFLIRRKRGLTKYPNQSL